MVPPIHVKAGLWSEHPRDMPACQAVPSALLIRRTVSARLSAGDALLRSLPSWAHRQAGREVSK